ncbi:MAG: protein arginine kinase, partial [Planctomycetota bacterium]
MYHGGSETKIPDLPGEPQTSTVNLPPIDPHRFAERAGAWLRQEGPDSDVVVSCRTRLARNLDGFPFVLKLETKAAVELGERVRQELVSHRLEGETVWVDMPSARPLVRLLLRERHLISRDLAPGDGMRAVRPGRAVAFGPDESVSVMVNEEDHLRLQSIAPGFDLLGAWDRVRSLDRALESSVGYAWNERLGYLTGCPTNVGTGLRASVMLHLPALGLVRSELEKVFSAAQRTGLAVRGMYGEGSRAAGDFYQISNQVTLGCTEEALIAGLQDLVPCVIAFERKVREVLLSEQRKTLEERVGRSLDTLQAARSLPTELALMHLSNLRLGSAIGLCARVSSAALNLLAVQIQKGHIQALVGDVEGDVMA